MPDEKSGRDKIAKDLILHLHEEVAELHRSVATQGISVRGVEDFKLGNVIDSGVDVLKLVISLLQLYGVESNEVYKYFCDKSQYIDHALKSARLEDVKENIIILDLDGCVSDMSKYSVKFKSFGETEIGENATFEKLKNDWYASGGFMDLPVIPGAAESNWELRKDWTIVIVTARPIWEHKRIGPDTVEWLIINDIWFDAIYFGKDKADIIMSKVLSGNKPKRIIAIEDRDKHAIELAAAGFDVLLMDQIWNRGFTSNSNKIRRVFNWKMIMELLKGEELWGQK